MKQEQPKQRLEKYSERFNNKENELVQGIFNPENWGNRLVSEEPKQETLEEVAERFRQTEGNYDIITKIAFEEGAKWQQQQNNNLYNEEEENNNFKLVLQTNDIETLNVYADGKIEVNGVLTTDNNLIVETLKKIAKKQITWEHYF